MVSFQAITSALAQNTYAAFQVATHRVLPPQTVASFKLPTLRVAPAVIPRAPKRPPSPVRSESSDSYASDVLPPPTRMFTKPVAALPVPALPVPALPVPALPVPALPVPALPVQARPERPARYVDPICLGIEHADAMYSIATANVKQTMECEEARRLEARIGELYKTESGRSRGWIKSKLEPFFLSRAAVGSRMHPKEAFAWEAIWTDKDASALLDYVCLAKGIRVAIWKTAERTIGLWPAADKAGSKDVVLVHVGNVGNRDIREAIREGWKLLAPLSVEHGLEKLTIDELDGLAEKMGITIPSGKKVEKVRALASARMAMRI